MSTSTTEIGWTDRTWNPVRGCSIVSSGCINCYAMKQAHRFSGKAYFGLTKQTAAGPQWTGKIRVVEDALLEPLSWRKPARVFVNSMSDLFHEDVPDEFVDRMFAVMALAPQHTFQILTKRAERMRDYMTGRRDVVTSAVEAIRPSRPPRHWYYFSDAQMTMARWPLPNVWLGVSVEDQKHADVRIPLLLHTPAAVRFVSAEPLLGPVDLTPYGWLCGCDACCNGDRCPGPPECMRFDRRSCPVCKGTAKGHNINWVIVGGESGPCARPFHIDWARAIAEQCKIAGVACFLKQFGSQPYQGGGISEALTRLRLHDRKGSNPAEWPEDLRGLREFPSPVAM